MRFTRHAGLMTLSFLLLCLVQLSPVSAAVGIDTIGPFDRQWTSGPVMDEIPLDIGPESREWTSFCKEQMQGNKLEDDLLGIEDATVVEQTDEGILVRFESRVFFENARARITDQARGVLDQVVKTLKAHPKTRVTLQGHTNNLAVSTARFANNQELSEARAQAARVYLVNRGISATRLTAEGYGASRPLRSNETAQGREMNRRVDFLFKPAESPE